MPNLTVNDTPTCTLDATICPSMCCTITGQCAISSSQCAYQSVSSTTYYYNSYSDPNTNYYNSSQYLGRAIGIPVGSYVGYLLIFVVGIVICYCRRKEHVEAINRMVTNGEINNGPVVNNGYNPNQNAHGVCPTCHRPNVITPTYPQAQPIVQLVQQNQVVRQGNVVNLNGQKEILLVRPKAKNSLPPIKSNPTQIENDSVVVQQRVLMPIQNIKQGEGNDLQKQVEMEHTIGQLVEVVQVVQRSPVQQGQSMRQLVEVVQVVQRAPVQQTPTVVRPQQVVPQVQQVQPAIQIHNQQVEVGVNNNTNTKNPNPQPYNPISHTGLRALSQYINTTFNRIFQKNAPFVKLISYQPQEMI